METQNNVDVVVTENASYETLSHRRAIFYVNKNNVDKEFFVLIDEGYGADNGKKYNLNFTCLATPAEGLSGRFVNIDRDIYGKIKGVTDRAYYTNSFHVPVYYNISIADKLRIEGAYHKLTNAGHISYIELDGDPSDNLEAFESVVRIMKESDIGYGAINHPVDRDPVCGYVGIIKDVCPRCGRKTGEPVSVDLLKRLEGKE